MELILNIMDAAVVQHRRDNLCWSLTLSLVCSTVRATVLPIIYEVIFLDIEADRQRDFVGWDGRTHKHAPLAFLSWVLHDRTAPPRQHIKQIFFRHDGHFGDEDLDWHDPGEASEPAAWMVERLTVRFPEDARCLFRAGIRPQKVFHIGSTAQATNVLMEPLVRMVRIVLENGLSHSHIWNRRPKHFEAIKDPNRISQRSQSRYEIDTIIGDIIPPKEVNRVLTIQLDDGDYLQRSPDVLRQGLAAGLVLGSDVQIILACNASYRIADQTVADFIRGLGTTLQGLSLETVKSRVLVSHAAWVPELVDEEAFCAVANALRCGRNPWSLGHAV